MRNQSFLLVLILILPTWTLASEETCATLVLSHTTLRSFQTETRWQRKADALREMGFVAEGELVQVPLNITATRGRRAIAQANQLSHSVPGWAYQTFLARISDRLRKHFGDDVAGEFLEATLFAKGSPPLPGATPYLNPPEELRKMAETSRLLLDSYSDDGEAADAINELKEITLLTLLDLKTLWKHDNLRSALSAIWAEDGEVRTSDVHLLATFEVSNAFYGPNSHVDLELLASEGFLPVIAPVGKFPHLEKLSPTRAILRSTTNVVTPNKRILFIQIPKSIQLETLEDVNRLIKVLQPS